jgi:hypothetical protein
MHLKQRKQVASYPQPAGSLGTSAELAVRTCACVGVGRALLGDAGSERTRVSPARHRAVPRALHPRCRHERRWDGPIDDDACVIMVCRK